MNPASSSISLPICPINEQIASLTHWLGGSVTPLIIIPRPERFGGYADTVAQVAYQLAQTLNVPISLAEITNQLKPYNLRQSAESERNLHDTSLVADDYLLLPARVVSGNGGVIVDQAIGTNRIGVLATMSALLGHVTAWRLEGTRLHADCNGDIHTENGVETANGALGFHILDGVPKVHFHSENKAYHALGRVWRAEPFYTQD